MAVVALAAVAVMEVVTAGVSERNPMRALPVFGSQFWDEVVDCGSGQGTTCPNPGSTQGPRRFRTVSRGWELIPGDLS